MPTASMSMPDTSTVTAYLRIAPTAMRTMDVPIPTPESVAEAADRYPGRERRLG